MVDVEAGKETPTERERESGSGRGPGLMTGCWAPGVGDSVVTAPAPGRAQRAGRACLCCGRAFKDLGAST